MPLPSPGIESEKAFSALYGGALREKPIERTGIESEKAFSALYGGALREKPTERTGIESEKAFSDLWERSLQLRPSVVDADGGEYEIVFPGVRNTGPGPDFRGAVLRHGGRALAGDIELHVDPSGWRAHGHHHDPAYRGVVLQVVLGPLRSAGSLPAPPTAAATFPQDERAPPDLRERPSETQIERLGLRRFLSKSAGYRVEMDDGADPDQTVYQSLLEGMGYARNRAPFLALAKSLPLRRFARLRAEPAESARFALLSALVVGGGLIGRVEARERAQMRRVARSLGVRQRVRPEEWSGFRVRPSAAPLSRMRGAASLVADHLRPGLLRGLLSVLDSDGAGGLIRAALKPPFIGRGFAVTLVANVVLPALHAWATLAGGDAPERALPAFMKMRAPPSDAVTRSVAKSLGISPRSKLAARHFGLHELARSASWPQPAGA